MPATKFKFANDVLEFINLALNTLLVLEICLPFLRKFGFTNIDAVNDVMPPNGPGFSVNTLFLYSAGCALVIAAGLAYWRLVLRELRETRAELVFDSVFSLGIVLGLWFFPSPWMSLLAAVLRGLSRFLLPRFSSRWAGHAGLVDGSAYLLYAALGVLTAIFCYHYWFKLFPFPFKPLPDLAIFIFLSAMLMLGYFAEGLTRWQKTVLDAGAVAAILLATFRNEVAYFDFSIILGPVLDVSLGKDIAANVVSTYGFLSIYFLSAVFAIFSVSDWYYGLTIANSVFYGCGYLALFAFFRWYSGNVVVSVLFIFSGIVLNFCLHHVPIHFTPQTGFLRFGAYLPVFFLIFALIQSGFKKVFLWPFAVVTTICILWSVETGIHIVTSLLAVVFLRFLSQGLPALRLWVAPLRSLAMMLFVILFLFSMKIYITHGAAPHFADIFYFQKLYASTSLTVNRLSSIGLWLIPTAIYLFTVFWCQRFRRSVTYADAWLFLAFVGLQSFLYFVGKRGLGDFGRVTLPALILLFVAAANIWRHPRTFVLGFLRINGRLAALTLMVLFSYGIYAATFTQQKPRSFFQLIADSLVQFQAGSGVDSLEKFAASPAALASLLRDFEGIRRFVPEGEPLLIISRNDTLYYLHTQRPSFFKNSFYPHFFLMTEVNRSAAEILAAKDPYLFVDNSLFQVYENRVSTHAGPLFAKVEPAFRKTATLGFLDVYERL